MFLYDCCHSIHAGSGSTAFGVKEALAAGGFETVAAEVGEHSFTHLLTNELGRATTQGRAISVSDLHGYMLAGFRDYTPRFLKDSRGKLLLDNNKRPRFEPPRRRTPVHYFISQKRESIVLVPLRPAVVTPQQSMKPPPLQDPPPAAPTDAESTNSGFIEITARQFPQVILSVRLESSESPDATEWLDWLMEAPSGAEEIKVEGWFGSFSTLIILNIPLNVWHTMPDNPAVSFVGFVTTENLVSAPPPNESSIARWRSSNTSIRHAPSVIADSAIELDSQSVFSHAVNEPSKTTASRWGTPLAFLKSTDTTSSWEYTLGLSCPFRKRNSVRFNIRDHQSCAFKSFLNISAVK